MKIDSLLLVAALSCVAANAASVTYNSKSAFTTDASVSLLDNFEAAGPKDTPLSTLTSQGITYTGLAGSPFPNVFVASAGYNNFGAGVGTTTSSVLTANGDEHFLAGVVSGNWTALGFDVYLNGLGPASVEFFNGATSLGLVSFASGDGIAFAGITSDLPVTSFEFVSTLGGRVNTGIDNVLTGSVPDGGSSAILLGLATLALGLCRRKQTC